MIVKSYEELGREADLAARAAASAKRTVVEIGSAEAMARRLVISIEGADWNNGLLHLVPHLLAAIQERVEELVPAAIAKMEGRAADALAEMRTAFEKQGDLVPGTVPQVPRMGRDAMSGYTTGFAAKDAEAEHAESVARMPDSPDGAGVGSVAPSGPGGPQAATGEGGGQVDLGHALGAGGAQDAPGKPPAIDKALTKPQAELLAWIVRNDRKTVAATADVQRLVTDGLVTRSGTGTKATYSATLAGRELDEGLSAA